MKNETQTVESGFLLGYGKNGTFTDIKIEISKSSESSFSIAPNTLNQDQSVHFKLKKDFEEWINRYEKKGILLSIKVIHIGIDKTGRVFVPNRAVINVMHEALPKIGVKPPPIFEP